jgi:hypothetical protein
MSGALKPQPLLDEITAQDALAHQFRKLGLEFSGLQPTIRTVMKRALIATGDVRQQVERFILVARMADQQHLSVRKSGMSLRRRTSGTDRILGS